MSERRNRTMMERMGFQDPELHSPSHDALVLWIGEHVREYVMQGFDPWRNLAKLQQDIQRALELEFENRQESIAESLKNISRWFQPPEKYDAGHYRARTALEIEEYRADCKGSYDRARASLEKYTAVSLEIETQQGKEVPLPAEVPPAKIETVFEEPVATDNQYIVGYVDVVAKVNYPYLETTGVKYSYSSRDDKVAGLKDDENVGLKFYLSGQHTAFYFEAKPVIKSMGELLRQVRTYQEYCSGKFVVVSPDTRFREPIVAQGIQFWESPHL